MELPSYRALCNHSAVQLRGGCPGRVGVSVMDAHQEIWECRRFVHEAYTVMKKGFPKSYFGLQR